MLLGGSPGYFPGKLVFEGTVEQLRCVTNDAHYEAVIDESVLELAGPFFRTREGAKYKRRGGQSQNE